MTDEQMYETVLYATGGPVATITLNRPDQLNTIVPPIPDEVEDAVARATHDATIKVIVLRGAGRAFCAGYDFGGGFKHWGDALETDGRWDPRQGLRRRHGAAARADAEAHERLALPEAGDRAGARLVRRGGPAEQPVLGRRHAVGAAEDPAEVRRAREPATRRGLILERTIPERVTTDDLQLLSVSESLPPFAYRVIEAGRA